MKFRYVLASVLSFLFVFSSAGLADARNIDLHVFTNAHRSIAQAFVSNEVIFRYKHDSERFRVLRVSDVRATIDSLRRNPDVAYAEPNYIAYAASVPNDPYFSPYQWNLDNPVNGGVHAEAAWDVTHGEGTVVAVIDTGIAYENYSPSGGRHSRDSYYQAPDLAGTCFVPGYDFVNNDSHPNDDNSHGTHVAGTLAQSTDNGMGTAGLAYGTCLMPVKALDANGSGSYATIADAIYYATDHGANVINMSLGGSFDSSVLHDAVDYAYQHGVTVVAAAGNDGVGTVSYPAAYNEAVIAVGATRYDETLASYSNYGSALDIVAPGGDTSVDQNGDTYGDGILQQTFNPNTKNTSDFGYWFFDGTSMATPHVAAAAAMVIAHGGATTPDDVRTALESSATDLGAPGRDDTYGFGLLNIPAALAWSSGPIDNPPSVTLSGPADGASVSGTEALSATANDDNGITGLAISVDDTVVAFASSSPLSTNWDSTQVADGTHTITATAYDTAGQSSSDSVTVNVDNVNDPPVANAGPDQSVFVGDTVNFDGSNSTDDRGISTYSWDFGDGNTGSGPAPSHAYAFPGSYTVTLTVVDTDGVSDSDTMTVFVSDVPTGPTEVIVDSVGYSLNGGRAHDRNLNGTAYILDDQGAPVSGASLSLDLTNTTRGGTWSYSGQTASDGSYSFGLNNAPRGCYSATVTSLDASGLSWDGTTPSNVVCK